VKKLNHERRIFLLALLTGLPALLVALFLLWRGHDAAQIESIQRVIPPDQPKAVALLEEMKPIAQTRWIWTILLPGLWLGCAWLVREKVRFPLQTLSNLLAALREGDYSIRARGADRDDALGGVILELNSLGEELREQRLGALEATALLSKVMAEIDLAVFTFDSDEKLRLVNRAGERLLAQPVERLLGRSITELGLSGCLHGEPARTIQATFPGGMGRWGMRRSAFREQGAPHHLLVLTDLSRTLREEERQAWQRLLRVLGHELNNSLAPIKSIAGSLEALLAKDPKPLDWTDDLKRGLGVISTRAAALTRFMEAYSRIARLPPPKLEPINLPRCVERVVALETRLKAGVLPSPPLCIQADGDQLDQLLINLLRNAVDAALETNGNVRVRWKKSSGHVEIQVEDEGPGLSNTANLFVPFFTTKQGGSGVGLVLCRQIAEAHGGSLTLENRPEGSGCVARLRLPAGAGEAGAR
jgi:two-component system, NtrC family, nitrogen regulation sensor histidine kinase NtrY